MRIPPIKIWEAGRFREDIARMIVSNMRVPADRLGDLHAQAEATRVGERRLLELIEKYGKDTVLAAMQECQDYVERVMRSRLKSLPKGSWETEDYLDADPGSGEGMVPIHVKLTIDDNGIHYDFSGSAPPTKSFLNSAYGATFSAVIAGTKTFFPDVPLNSGFYRVVTANLPENTVVNAKEPIAVTGFCSGVYEKVMNSIFELWSYIMPERALACSFNLEYLLVGGWDRRPGYGSFFMWYDWMAGGWGGRNGRDGCNATSPVFGVGLAIQPVEGQERLTPVLTTCHEIITDSGGPGQYRGGCGVRKGGILTAAEQSVMSYCCDRGVSITWGLRGGLPSIPHGVWLNPGKPGERYLGTTFSGVPVQQGDEFIRPSAGGGGYGDPLLRDPKKVCEDVREGYVSLQRARKDYGVVIKPIDPELGLYEIDYEATEKERAYIRAHRKAWLEMDPEQVLAMYLQGEIDLLDTIRRYGVLIDRRNNTVLPCSTEQFRAMLKRRMVLYWT